MTRSSGSPGPAAAAFEIRVQGWVDPGSLDDLDDLAVSTASASTVLTCTPVDQAELLAVLARLRSHGLVITEVRRLVGEVELDVQDEPER